VTYDSTAKHRAIRGFTWPHNIRNWPCSKLKKALGYIQYMKQ